MFEWLILLLLPVALWIGWRLGRKAASKTGRRQENRFSNRYFRGLNYLLNEQPDKAIEVFLKLAEVNQDTVETHFALGSLFRRRGEVDRAILFHQNIIAKPTLSDRQRTRALLELGEDYMRAGLLDRAERLFSELIERDVHTPSALGHLLDIYQQEKDWPQAIEIAGRLEKKTAKSMGRIMAHFCCEMADEALTGQRPDQARAHLRQARRYHPSGLRARRLEAELAAAEGDFNRALTCYQEILQLEPGHLAEIIEPLIHCYRQLGEGEQLFGLLQEYVQSHHGTTPLVALAQEIESRHGASAEQEFLLQELGRRPTVRGMQELLDSLEKSSAGAISREAEITRILLNNILEKQHLYRCNNCGFGGQQHHWQCPSCRSWDSTRRIQGVMGE